MDYGRCLTFADKPTVFFFAPSLIRLHFYRLKTVHINNGTDVMLVPVPNNDQAFKEHYHSLFSCIVISFLVSSFPGIWHQ